MLQTSKFMSTHTATHRQRRSTAVMFKHGQYTSFIFVIHFWFSVYVLHFQSTAGTLLIDPDAEVSGGSKGCPLLQISKRCDV